METAAHTPSWISLLANEHAPCELSSIQIRPFEPGDEVAFRELNEAWIARYFVLEDADRKVLNDPVGNILNLGGHIFMAVDGPVALGCCALAPMHPGTFELAKMAVLESQRGRGIGRKLLEYAVAYARKIEATYLYLETNRSLANAIHLYESVGFQHVSPDQVIPSPYARANVFMEMKL